MRLRGGQSTLFVDVTNVDALEKVAWAQTAPNWRRACYGLNVEGICTNAACEGKGQLVICHVGLASYRVGTDAACICCGGAVRPTTCAFANCSWRYDGLKVGGVQMLSPWYQAGNQYERFREAGNMVEWDRLVLTVRSITTVPHAFHAQAECAICFETIQSTNRAVTTCNHGFHTRCLVAWTREHDSCPLCRAEV